MVPEGWHQRKLIFFLNALRDELEAWSDDSVRPEFSSLALNIKAEQELNLSTEEAERRGIDPWPARLT